MRLIALAVGLPLAALSASLAPPRGAPTCPPGSTTVVEVVRDTIGPGILVGDRTLSVPRFRPGPGRTLLAAEVRLRLTTTGGVRLENKDPLHGCLGTLHHGTRATVLASGLPPGFSEVQSLREWSVSLAAFDGQIDFAGPSGTAARLPRHAGEIAAIVQDPPVLAERFEGPGRYALRLVLEDLGGYEGCAPCTFLSDVTAHVALEVRYTVCVAP